MRPLHHREPGPITALVEDPRVTIELINDGVHLHPALYRNATKWVGPDRVALITDAMAAAGMSDGAYTLGALDVDVTDGKKLTMEDVFIVWFSKTLQNWKALVSTTVSDGMYYEITHDGDKGETYLDAYKKWDNQCIVD